MPSGIKKSANIQNSVAFTSLSMNCDIKPQINAITPNNNDKLDNLLIFILDDVAKQTNAVVNRPLKNIIQDE